MNIQFDVLSQKIHPTHYDTFDVIPCAVRLFDGSTFERVSIIKRVDFDLYWWLADESSMLKSIDVDQIFESGFRVPCKFSNIMAAAPENGMGYRRFWLSFTEGRKLLVTAGNLNDFFDFPDGYNVCDITGVEAVSGYEPIETQAESRPVKWLVV